MTGRYSTNVYGNKVHYIPKGKFNELEIPTQLVPSAIKRKFQVWLFVIFKCVLSTGVTITLESSPPDIFDMFPFVYWKIFAVLEEKLMNTNDICNNSNVVSPGGTTRIRKLLFTQESLVKHQT